MFRISPSTSGGTPPRLLANKNNYSQQQQQQQQQTDNHQLPSSSQQYPSPPTLSLFTNNNNNSDNQSIDDVVDEASNLRRRRDFDALSSMENTTPQGTRDEENQTVSFSNVSIATTNISSGSSSNGGVGRNKKKRKKDSLESGSPGCCVDVNNIELDDGFENKFSKVINNFEDVVGLKDDKCLRVDSNRYTGPRFESTNKTISRYGDDNRTFIVGLLGYEFNENEIEVTPTNDSTGLIQRLGRLFSNIFSSGTSINQTLPLGNGNGIGSVTTTTTHTSITGNPLRHHTFQEDHNVIHSNPAPECELISHWREIPMLRNVKIKQISCGGYHVLILTEDHVVYASGWNKYGQLGTRKSGSSSKIVKLVEKERSTAIEYCEAQSFHKIEFPEKIVSLNASGRHSLFLSESGRVYGAGCNLHGRMGSDFIEAKSLGLLTPRRELTQQQHQGQHHEPLEPSIDCGVFEPILLGGILKNKRVYYVGKAFWHSVIATCDGGVYVMGQSDEGKLGIGSTRSSNDQDTHCYEPTEVVELRGREIIEAEGGAWHTIFLTKSKSSSQFNNDVWVCGSNYWGQLAIHKGNNQSIQSAPVPIIHPFFSGPRDPSKNVVQITAGSNFNAVLCEDGSVYCFGCGSSGKTGLGHSRTVRTPIKVQSIPQDVIKIATGSNHLIIITKSGEMYSTGWNFYGQCGYDTDISSIAKVEPPTSPRSNEQAAVDRIDNYCMPRVRRLSGVEVNSAGCGAYFTLITTSSTSNPIIRKQKEQKFKGVQVRNGFNDISIKCNK